MLRSSLIAYVLVAANGSLCVAQSGPVNGMRQGEIRIHAITNAKVVIAPGKSIENASIIIRDGIIEAVGKNLTLPPEARIWPGDGLTVYSGLIDAAVLVSLDKPQTSPGSHWNSLIHPQWNVAEQPLPTSELRKELRELGFATAAVYPEKGILRGTGVVVCLAEKDSDTLAYKSRAMMAGGFDRGRGGYPGSLMGSIALLRQTLYDTIWHETSLTVFEQYPQSNEPPIRADALVALQDAANAKQTLLFEVSDELNALRIAKITKEFNLDITLLGSGYEFRRLQKIVKLGFPIIVPLEFPERPNVSSVTTASNVSLRQLMTWEQAPTNLYRLVDAGSTVAITTHRLKKRSDFHKNLHNAIRHGLTKDDALASLTTIPAKLLGLDNILGTIESGKAANLVVVEGSLFEKKPKIRDVWVNGTRHEISSEPKIKMVGSANLSTSLGIERELKLDTTKKSISITLGEEKIKVKKVVVKRDQISFVVEGKIFDVDGFVLLSGVITDETITGSGILPDGAGFGFTISLSDTPIDDESETEDEDEEEEDEFHMPPDELVFPLGAFGFAQLPTKQNLIITNATIWTSGPKKIIQDGEMEIRDGKIIYVGAKRNRHPKNALVINAAGKHITPGLIDCHSHTAISSGVNEGGQTNTAEVRIGDVINPDDINIYRQLAGGLTAANQLHGSANPIGGQNSVIKLRWGADADTMSVKDAIGGIKFALGENVVRRQTRYPNTRMGVETFMRDAFTAAKQYQADWKRYKSLSKKKRNRTMPPQRDLELDTLVEILNGKRLIHCHSYRQDEILMLIRLADDFGFTIGTFQHVLEGYKVADAIAAHGAGASTFSDWWAYKVEVMDAIPYNAAIMHDVGVVVSINSDSSELARRMNTEAAKAVRYGGLDPHDALNVVTINPAIQLRIDHRTGSLEVGKDADFVIWSQYPLSVYARCEQTWIEGAKYFDIEQDRLLREHAMTERQRIIQKILKQTQGKSNSADEEPTTEPESKTDPPWAYYFDDADKQYSCTSEDH